ncbi:uncharacterized protein CDAR_175861 [Caerostris darwini]|uniref:DUF7041 domain-containing protein n=1 Tax=Caerostris darwini TaxID=1538125 RepID=A0AAV4WN35_9ARAC|nr:uncharacterized protein CDAR_175861 [Caerostris darwini]
MKLLRPSEFQDTIKSPIQEALSQPAQQSILLPISQQKQQMKLLQMSPSESQDAIKSPIYETSSQHVQQGILLPISQQRQQLNLHQMFQSESRSAIKSPIHETSFATCTTRYSTSHITTEVTTEVSAVVLIQVSALQPEELAVVSDIILKPPADVPFTALKKRLCAQYSDSETQRLRDLISAMQLSDRRPSRLLEMRSKAGARIKDDLLKSLFLQRLPTNVQQILAISNDNLAEMADGIMSTSSAPVINTVAASADQPGLRTMLYEITSLLEARTRDQSRGRNQRHSASRSRQTENPLLVPQEVQTTSNKMSIPMCLPDG